MAVDDFGIEVLKKAADEITPGDKSEYILKVKGVAGQDAIPVSFDSLPVAPSPDTTGQRNTLTVSTTAVAISTVSGVPLTDRKVVRIAPIGTGRFYWGFSSSVTSSNAEFITRNTPLTLEIGDSIDVFLIRSSGSQDVAIYEVS